MNDPVRFTPTETQILQALADGLSPKAIADARCVSLRTVNFHLSSVYIKLKVHRLVAAINEARRLGLID
jgi:DNA-binding NarL/FixJ family response regulator